MICTDTLEPDLLETTWSCTPITPLPEGLNNLEVVATNRGQNDSVPTPFAVTVDTTPPAAPAITAPTDGSSTNDDTPTVTGVAEPGSTVEVTDGSGNVLCTTTADVNGDYSCTTTPLPEGPVTLEVIATDPAGNISPPTVVDVIVDTTDPAAPVVTGPSSGSTITDTTPTITGVTEPGSTVDVTDGSGNPVCTATADASGNWSCTPTSPLPNGGQTLEVIATDPAGNVSPPTSLPITVLAELSIDLHVYLGGAYVYGSTLMRDALRSVPGFPTTDPYSQAPYASKFIHVGGGGGETIGSGVLTRSDNSAIVDWVFIELRSTPTTVVATHSALVQRDGQVVAAADGSSMVGFAVAPGNYYVVVRHRNHLGVMTANPVALGATTAVVDFTTGVGIYGGDGLISEQPFGAAFALRPGDADANGAVKYSGSPNDLSVVRNSFFVDNNFTGSLSYAGPEVTNVYHRADLNLDGNVRNVTDVAVLRNTVLQFPANTLGYLNISLVVTTVP